MITLTSAAARELIQAIETSDADDLALRIAARVSDAGDIEFGMGFDEQREDDAVFEEKGVLLLIGKPSQALLCGAVLDFVETEPGRFGFVFSPAPENDPPVPGGSACGPHGCAQCGGAA